ncbi:Cytochrome c1 heme lyase, partial [Globisporangium splendens]
MTAEVNSAAAAAGCPHHQPHASSSNAANAKTTSGATDKDDTACGFSSQMMAAAQHAGGWRVATDSAAVEAHLSQERVVSSIPKSDFTPAHQSGERNHWEYPSEAMYFNAMKRKGWDPEAEQMKTIVAIHNTVNEQSWAEVLRWESFHPSKDAPRLKRFIGKPTEYSPKARAMHLLGWSVLPFDRHDWIVERGGKEVRYVIDFYSGQPVPGRPLSVYLDVRPALDSVESVVDRLRWQFNEKIRPLLPFEGVFGGKSGDAASTTNAVQPPSTAGRSTVTPKEDKN